ncbi:unnamed protein product [Merluccius merluccius]
MSMTRICVSSRARWGVRHCRSWHKAGLNRQLIARAFDMPRTSVHRAIHTTSGKIAALFAQTVHHPTEEELALEVDILFVPEVILCCIILHICLSRGDVLDPEDGVAGAAGEEDPGQEAAPPGTVSGAEERYRMAALISRMARKRSSLAAASWSLLSSLALISSRHLSSLAAAS